MFNDARVVFNYVFNYVSVNIDFNHPFQTGGHTGRMFRLIILFDMDAEVK